MSESVDAAAIVAKKRALAAKAAVKRRQKKAPPPPPSDRPWYAITGGPLNLTGVRDKAYNMKFMHIIFTVSCGLMLLTVAWMVVDDWVREWKEHQRNFRHAKIEKLKNELQAAREGVDQNELTRIDARIEKAKELIVGQADSLEVLEAQIAEAQGQVFLANNMVFQIEKAVLDTDRRLTDEAVYDDPETGPAVQAGYARDAYSVDNYFKDYQLRKAEYDRLVATRNAIFAELKKAEKERDALVGARDQLAEKLERETHWFNLVVDAPMADFIAPNLKVEGVITPNLFNDYNFNNVRKIEHCMTCHQAIDTPGFEEGLDYNGDGDWDDAEDMLAHPYKTHPHRTLLLGGTHPVKMFGCSTCHQGNGHALDFVHSAHIANAQDLGDTEIELDHGHSLDPRLDALMVTYKQVTAETGQETPHSQLYDDLYSKQQLLAKWNDEYNYEAVWKSDMDHYWDWPQLPSKYLTASCSKCHMEEQVIPGADMLNRGRELVEQKGCYACHKMDIPGLRIGEDIRKTGPDLRHVAQKIARGAEFVERWLWYPKTFRPLTHMPRFWGNLNSESGDGIVRAEAEVRAMTHLILGTRDESAGTGQHVDRQLVRPDFALAYDASEAPALLDWLQTEVRGDDHEDDEEADEATARARQLVLEGRNAFRALGCLGCHQNDVDGLGTSEHGPVLSKIGSKVNPAWLFDWLKNPKEHWPETIMPDLRLSDDEATVLVNYLMLFRDDSYYRQDVLSKERYDETPEEARENLASMLVTVDGHSKEDAAAAVAGMSDAEVAAGIEDRVLAYMVLNRAGDLSSYLIEMERGLTAPEEPTAGRTVDDMREERDKRIASEVAAMSEAEVARAVREKMLRYMTYQKMTDNMPFFEAREKAHAMSDDELLQFVGNATMNRFGCFACHNINGYLDAQPIGVELTYEAAKELDKLDFGFWHHTLEHNKQDWFLTKLLSPRIYDVIPYHHPEAIDLDEVERNPYVAFVGDFAGDSRPRNMMTKLEKDRLRMPHFDLTREEAEALTCFLLGRVKEPIPEEMMYTLEGRDRMIEDGRRLVKEYNCAGCHYIGNDVESYMLPPDLDGVADVQRVIAGVSASDTSGKLQAMGAQLDRLVAVLSEPLEVPYHDADWNLDALAEVEAFETGVKDFAKVTAKQYGTTLKKLRTYVASARAAGAWDAESPELPSAEEIAALEARFKGRENRDFADDFKNQTGFSKLTTLLFKIARSGEWRDSDNALADEIAAMTPAAIDTFFANWAAAEAAKYAGDEDNDAKRALREQVEVLTNVGLYLAEARGVGVLRPVNHFWLEGDVYQTSDGGYIQGRVLEADSSGMKFQGNDYSLGSYTWDDILGEKNADGMKAPLAHHGAILTAPLAQEGGSVLLADILVRAGVQVIDVRGLGEGQLRDMVDHVSGRPLYSITDKANAPPILPDEGEKINGDWVFEFLKRPYKLRPRVNVRMPTFYFTDQEAEQLAAYFAAKSEVAYPFEYHDGAPLSEEEVEWAEGFLQVQCYNCHIVDRSAPTLGLAAERLRPDWIKSWLQVPEHRQPGTAMPKVFFIDSKELGRLMPYLNGEDGEYESSRRDGSELGATADDEIDNDVDLDTILGAEAEQRAWRQQEIDVLTRYLLDPNYDFLDPDGSRLKRE